MILSGDAVVEDGVLGHAIDASFLWAQRERASIAPDYVLSELADIDRRLEANLERLVHAGAASIQIYAESLGSDAGDAFVLSYAAANFGPGVLEEVIATLEEGPEAILGVSAALGWLPLSVAQPIIERWQHTAPDLFRCIAVAAATAHRHDLGGVLGDAATSENPALRAQALRAAGELGREDMQLHVQRCFNDADLDCRYQARRSSLLLRVPNAAVSLIEATLSGRDEADDACRLAMRFMRTDLARDLYQDMRNDPATHRLAVIGAGATGDPAYVPAILEAMASEELARPAADAMLSITGLDIVAVGLTVNAPEDHQEGPTDDPDDSNVDIPVDLALPWPAVDAVTAWWNDKGKSRLSKGTRYLMGLERNDEGLRQVLAEGNQRLRGVAAFELAHTAPEVAATFDPRAPASRQLELMARLAESESQ